MQEVSASTDLLLIDRDHKLNMLDRSIPGPSHLLWVGTLGLVESLPGAECRAVWRTDNHERLVAPHHLQGFVSLSTLGEIPWLIVLWVVDNQIQSKTWYEVSELLLLARSPEFLGDARRRIHL